MKQKLANLIKYNKLIYSIYYNYMCAFLKVLSATCKTDNKLVLFNSYAGRKFDDSPRAIYEVMKKDPRFQGYRLVWAFHEPKDYLKEGLNSIKTDSLRYFITALKAKVWITNSSVERGLKFKKKETIYINTWHGTPIKKMGTDIIDNQSFKPKNGSKYDAMNAQSDYEVEVFSRSFGVPKDKFLKVGLPRNDILNSYTIERRDEIRKRLKIPADKKAILYCPTFREYAKDEFNGVVMIPPMDMKKWEKELGTNYILLVRAHYEVSNVMKIEDNSFVRNVTLYPVLNELMIASDILISDYSSIFFDYSIMDKPMLHFAYDYEEYEKKRGMYFDIREYLLGSDNEDDLIKLLKMIHEHELNNKTRAFHDQFMNYYGDAARKTVDHIASLLYR